MFCDSIIKQCEKRKMEMKKIYTFTLDDEDCPSVNIKGEVSTIAYLLYEKLKDLEGISSQKILVMNKNLCENELLDVYMHGRYVFSKFKDEKSVLCEPFMLSDTSFGITVYDGVISDSEMSMLLANAKRFIHSKCSFKIDSITYEVSNIDDERMRKWAIKDMVRKNNTKVLTKTRKYPVMGMQRKLV